jgi:hypothetical protein
MELFHRRAHRAGIGMLTDRVVLDAAPGVVLSVLEHTVGTVTEVRYDWVVTAVPPRPRDGLWTALREPGDPPVHRVGDCLAPRLASSAVRDGHRAALAL